MPITVARICAAALAIGFVLPAFAGRFEGFVGAWAPDISGTLRNGPTTYDLDSNLGIDADPQRQFALYFRPEKRWYWPDLSAHYDHLGAEGNGQAASIVQVFGPLTIPANSQLYSTVSINDYDASADIPFDLYGVHVGAGATLKYLVGNVTVHTLSSGDVAGVAVGSFTGTSYNRLDNVFPLVHLRAETDLASWLSLVGSGNYIEYEKDRVYEFRGQADLRPLDPITLSIGYQRKSYLVSRGSFRLDTDIDGLFFGVGLLIR
jgi:hypothetical protein